jgi:small subunit ribosomal protein S17
MNSNVEKRVITARVVSRKMDKTATVLIERVVKHPVYGKYVKRSTKVLIHDEHNQCCEGDVVYIASCRPISKRKAFRLVEIVGRV